MDQNKLFEIIDSKKQEYIDFFRDVVEIESPTEYKPGVDAVGKYIAKKAEEKGFKVEIFPIEVSGDIVSVTLNPDAKGKPICLSGHIDTVHPLGFFGEPCVRIEDGKLMGPGAEDCKGGVVSGFYTLDALKEIGYTERPVKLILQTDEETSSRGSKKATMRRICEEAKDAEAFLNLEPYAKGKATVERKGICKYEITVKGKAIHASRCNVGASAVAQAANMIIEFEKYKDIEDITCNCGLISGGTAVNTVPCECKFSLDFRFRHEDGPERIENIVKEICSKTFVEGTSCEYERASLRLCMPHCERNVALFNKINSIMEKVGFDKFEYGVGIGGSDAADITAYGIPVIDSIGASGGGGHTINEFVVLDSLAHCAKVLSSIIVNF